MTSTIYNRAAHRLADFPSLAAAFAAVLGAFPPEATHVVRQHMQRKVDEAAAIGELYVPFTTSELEGVVRRWEEAQP